MLFCELLYTFTSVANTRQQTAHHGKLPVLKISHAKKNSQQKQTIFVAKNKTPIEK